MEADSIRHVSMEGVSLVSVFLAQAPMNRHSSKAMGRKIGGTL